MTTHLKHLKVAPKDVHTSTIIFLHGLGDSGHGWLPVAKQLWTRFPNVKWILPHAPTIPITINGGSRMPGWFDLSTLDRLLDPTYDDERGLSSSVSAVDALIQSEVDAGIPENKIIVGGFSQGGAVALLLGLTTRRRLGGIIGLSTWVPLSHKVGQMVSSHATETPIFWGHGRDDPIVHYTFGEMSLELLTKLGYPRVPNGTTFSRPGIRFEGYPRLGHSSSPTELTDMSNWITEALR
ncbi:acyl-protein thioesterase 1 [Tremella mesenterica]|uniref:Acyl-protein thioesterase 1 n=1 Tax=Tremella mesenterica TaxID=5217 RepID=A0A4Q1BKB2_TREME|nr:acyl-protein thioesterase 1 [Tremella mesenterica]